VLNDIPQIKIREIPTPEPPVIRPVQFPQPVMNMPGCAAVHPDAGLNPSLLKDDPGRVGYACPDGGFPSLRPMDFTPSELTILEPQGEAEQEKSEPPTPQTPKLPEIPKVQAQEEQPPEPKRSIPQQIVDGLPEVPAVVTTASIALVATTSALLAKPLADLLLKLIKPAIKKIVAKIKALLGRKTRRLSLAERRLAQRDRNHAVMALRRSLGR
jgi:hypothetical protein